MIPGLTPVGAYPLSVLPDDFTAVSYTDTFQAFIDDVRIERVYVVALHLYNPVTAQEEIIYVSSHAFTSELEQPVTPAVTYSISPTGGTLLWNNSMLSQERIRSVYRSGIRRNTNRY